MQIHRIEVPGLAHYSYVVSSNGKAVVIDPKRDFDTYIKFAEAHNLTLTHILETHIHADFASGARALAQTAGADLWLSGHDEGEDFSYGFPHHEFRDGEELIVGDLRFVALHTPGHTPEHLSFVLHDKARAAHVPLAVFSGDFLFVGSLGRPDLLGDAATQRLARELFRSVRERISQLPDGVAIYPAHGSGSLCGSGISESQQSTLGYERAANSLLSEPSEQRFVKSVLGCPLPFPDYYRRMKRVNSAGPAPLSGVPGKIVIEPADLREAVKSNAAEVLDLRRPEAFGGAHILNSFNIGEGQNLSMWAAWILPYDRPIYLVGEETTDYEEASRSLIRVGLDQIAGFLKGGIRSWIESGYEQAHLPQVSVEELDARKTQVYVLDVRNDGEWKNGHIEGAEHIPAGDLTKSAPKVARNKEIAVICGSGYRSSIACSILLREGFTHTVNVAGGMGAWNARGLATTNKELVCSS
jgi:hydroxyacylglutathione hydrolase